MIGGSLQPSIRNPERIEEAAKETVLQFGAETLRRATLPALEFTAAHCCATSEPSRAMDV